MNLRIFIQRSECNVKKDEYYKNKTKIDLPSQYSISFPGKHSEVVYIIVSIRLNICKDMDSDH